MSVEEQIEKYLLTNKFEVSIPVEDFIMKVSNIYHEFESNKYDSLHSTMFDISSSYLQQIIENNYINFSDEIVLLDYGCGTGYAVKQLLKSKIKKKIKKVVCFDLSSHMIDKCKENLKKDGFNKNGIDFIFLSGKDAINTLKKHKFNLIITNALLHHLLSLEHFFSLLETTLMQNGIYIAGHEPNANYYLNQELIEQTKKFQRFKHFKGRLSLKYILNKLKIKKNISQNIFEYTNDALIKAKIISKKLPTEIIPKLVDIHVPIGVSKKQIWGEYGFSSKLLINKYCDTIESLDFISYFHIKDYKAYSSSFWKKKSEKLAKKYPNDGADCIMLFKKVK